MKIHEYNEMMAYLTRPARTGFKHGGTWKDYMLRGEEYKDLSFEEWLREDKAYGGRIGLYKGESVVKALGQQLIDLVEAGESSVSIAKRFGLSQSTVNAALNSIDKGLAGKEYKFSKPLKDFYTPTNQYTDKLITENTELINSIKKDAETMSQIEVEKKYKKQLGKKKLKQIKDQEGIEFRKSYLPEGTQKKSIPYADRYTAKEKSEMYKKRKATETEADRIKKRERDAKYRDKIYKDYKMEPSSRGFKDDLWKDITRSANEGDRIKLIEGPKYASGANYDKFKNRRFLDTLTNTEFGYDDLEKYLDSGKLKNVTYESVSNPYKLKWQINDSGLREEIQKAYFGDKYQSPKMFRAQNTFHVHHVGGVAADPFTTQLTFADQNLGLVSNKKFNKEWAKLIERNAPLSERKAYLKFVKSKIGDNIAQTLEFPEVGKTRTYGEMGTDIKKLLSDPKFKNIKGLKEIKFKANMVPGLETLINTVKSIPDDFKARRYWTLGLKSLGIAATPLIAYDGYTAIKEGLPADEVVARALLGADKLLYKGKEVLQLTPEEREARKIVQQEKMTKQIADDFSDLDSDFYTPPVDSDLTVEEAKAKWKEGQDRYADFREKKDAARAGKRKDIWTAITDPQEILSREISAAEGGRVGFDEGSKPKNPGRRAFLKGITALAALPIVGKYFKLGKVLERASTYTGPAIDKVKGMPEWFPSLVKKLWNEGEDVTKQVAFGERQVVKRGTLEGGDDVDLIYQTDTGDVSIQVRPKKGNYETTSGAYNKEYELDYIKGQADETTKGKKPPDEFSVTETEPIRTGHPEDPDWDWDGIDTNVDDAITDLTELEAFAKNKTTTQIHKKKGTKPKDVNPEVEYDHDPDYDPDYD